jgi:hypothetical protein
VPSPNPAGSTVNNLRGVAATSPRNAWAVGYYHSGTASADKTLIEHWNGSSWTLVPSPNPGVSAHSNYLRAVAATSASNAWAVGDYFTGSGPSSADHTLIEHWNGTSWKHVPSPSPGGAFTYDALYGVAATSPSNAWAVGSSVPGSVTLTEHWNGSAWAVVPSPNPGGTSNQNILTGVAMTSATNVWAVGLYFSSTVDQDQTLAIHCN